MLVACPVAKKQKALDICNAFIGGAPKSAEGYVFYGVNETNLEAWNKAKKSGRPWYYIDNSYFDAVRGKQLRVTKNAIQIQNAAGQMSDGKRFDALDIEIKPWKDNRKGEYWIACEQSLQFMVNVVRDPLWLERTLRDTANGWPIQLRPWNPDKLKIQTTLVEHLKGARRLVAHTSAAAVTALLEGVPVTVSEHSAVYGVKYGDQRLPVMQVLADNQFLISELKDGTAWSHLNSR
jgi:hypothetical protein